ncbi:MAG: Uma2 family endonuclease [Pyrinomonadaceae bacterium]|nr:Uma2 family endonuclease [Pyrinomonadaceae bacterium]MDQ3584977.1 Uma2 family endonuclease [Acidobacteriota bacterium]
MSQQFARRWFSVGEYQRMAETGILTEDDRVELIEGEIIEMSPIGNRHAACVKRLNALLSRQLGQSAIVSVQDPIYLNDFSEPEPDIALLLPREDFYEQELPAASDVLLLVEVADTSIDYDRNKKLPLYARAGIPEMWLVDLSAHTITIYAQPLNSQYQFVQTCERGEAIASQTLAGLTLPVDEILG